MIHPWKNINKNYNFALDFILIGDQEVMASQSYKSPTLLVLGLPFGSPETKRPFGCGLHGAT